MSRPVIRRVQFRLKTLLMMIAGLAAVIVTAQATWRHVRTDAAWRSFPQAGELRRSTASTLLNPKYEIDVSNNPNMRDSDLAALSGLSTIEHLDVSNTPLTDQCLADLKSLRNLKSMNIAGTRISRRGADDLQKSLPACTISR